MTSPEQGSVLVAGASGFVGRRLVPVLVEAGHDVRAMTRHPDTYEGAGTPVRGDVHDPDLNRHSITVGEVKTSPDLKVATAYVLPLGGQGAEDALAALRRNAPELRHLVAKAMTLKYAPQLRFVLDETFDRMDDTRRLFADERVRRDLDAPDDGTDED